MNHQKHRKQRKSCVSCEHEALLREQSIDAQLDQALENQYHHHGDRR